MTAILIVRVGSQRPGDPAAPARTSDVITRTNSCQDTESEGVVAILTTPRAAPARTSARRPTKPLAAGRRVHGSVGAVRILLDYRPALRERTGVGEYVHQLARALAAGPDEVDRVHVLLEGPARSAGDAAELAPGPDRRSADSGASAECGLAPVRLAAGRVARRRTVRRRALAQPRGAAHRARRRRSSPCTTSDFLDHPGARVGRNAAATTRPRSAPAPRAADAVVVPSRYTAEQVDVAARRAIRPGLRLSPRPAAWLDRRPSTGGRARDPARSTRAAASCSSAR